MESDIINELAVVVGFTYLFLVVAPYALSYMWPYQSALVGMITLMCGSIICRAGLYGEYVWRLAKRIRKYLPC